LKVSFKLVEIFRYIEEMDEKEKNKITSIKRLFSCSIMHPPKKVPV
jgi:hypothetical protein